MAAYGHLMDADLDEDVHVPAITGPLDILSLGPGPASPERSATTDSYSLVSAQADAKDSPLMDPASETLHIRSDSNDLDLLGGSGMGPSPSRFGAVSSDPLSGTANNNMFEDESLEESPKRVLKQHYSGGSVNHSVQQQQQPPVWKQAGSPLSDENEDTAETASLIGAGSGMHSEGPGHPVNEESPIRVTVRDPEKVEIASKLGIRNHYVSYLVRTDSGMEGFKADGMEVRRRFSEFEALHKMLKHSYRGYFIPPLPDKSYIDSKLAQDDFLRLRRADLQAFLRGIAHHPVMREAEVLKVFLLQPGELQYNPAWVVALQSTHSTGATNLASLLDSTTAGAAASGWVSWMRHSVTSPIKRVMDEEELQLRESKELLRDLERLLQLSCESARMTCAHMEAMAGGLFELGRNMGMLSKFEEAVQAKSGQYTQGGQSAAARGTDCKKLAIANSKQHTVWKNTSVKAAASLVALHDYYILVPEAIAAWRSGPVGGREKRQHALQASMEKLELMIKASQDSYSQVKQRNQSELMRLNLERETDFHRMFQNFTATQAQLVQSSANMWATAARQFSAPEDSSVPQDLAEPI
ncbi:MAG: hypothetical protein WDW38_001665 [Sanguina aurantia]